jgi:hypothetical protein
VIEKNKIEETLEWRKNIEILKESKFYSKNSYKIL